MEMEQDNNSDTRSNDSQGGRGGRGRGRGRGGWDRGDNARKRKAPIEGSGEIFEAFKAFAATLDETVNTFLSFYYIIITLHLFYLY